MKIRIIRRRSLQYREHASVKRDRPTAARSPSRLHPAAPFVPLCGRILRFALLLVFCLWTVAAFAADKLPPPPPRYFNDFAGLVSKQTAERLNSQLEQFERDSSNQIVVVIYPKLETDLTLEDFTQRTAESWRVGQKKLDNGAVLFVFAQDRKLRIEVGYGLEGAIPDITARQIIDNEIKPAFRAGNYEAGVAAGVDALIKAARGEYKGTGRTVAEGRGRGGEPAIGGLLCPLLALFFIFLFMRGLFGRRRGTMYGPRGRRYMGGGWPPFIFWGGGGGGGGGGWGGGGGFSGGGGSFGGGGASGDW